MDLASWRRSWERDRLWDRPRAWSLGDRHDAGPRAMSDVATQDAAMVHTRRSATRQRRRPICRVVAFPLLLALNACSSADHQGVHFTGKRVAPTSPTGPAIPRIPAHALKV